MGVPGSANLLLLGGERGYQIERSLRFNSADSAYLTRTPASDTSSNKKGTFSFWMKVSSNSGTNGGAILGAADTYYYGQFYNETLYFGNDSYWVNTAAVFRDFSAWYHVVFVFDTTLATTNDRMIIYVNNVRQTVGSFNNQPTQNASFKFLNTAQQYQISGRPSGGYFNGYLTEVHFIDGQALTPSSFGETDTITGVWKPKAFSGGSYGTNGFKLTFSDNSGTTSTTLGKDSSGNGNNWTPNNFSVTAGAGNDSMIDTPTPYADGGNGRGNYCTWNPLNKDTTTLSNGNLNATMPGRSAGTFAVSSGKWYWECTYNAGNGYALGIGIANVNAYYPAEGFSFGVIYYGADGSKYVLGANSSYSTSYSGGTFGIALDLNSAQNTIEFFLNGTSKGVINISSGITWTPLVQGGSGSTTGSWDANFGQRSFSYTPPAGFLALNTNSLPEPSIKKPSSYFNVELWSGSGTTNARTGLGFSPDLVWVKARGTNANSHYWYDAVRGVTKYLNSDATGAEGTETGGQMTSFDSNGFTVATNDSHINKSGNTYVAWCWDESATPGFDIVTYTGTGSNTDINHSLGVTPSFAIIKQRNTAQSWWVWHNALGNNVNANNTMLELNGMAGTYAADDVFRGFTSSVFKVGTDSGSNTNGGTYVAYLWSEVAGFSKFGSYTGNGSTDGVYVHCGFRPKLLIWKRTDSSANWFILDAARNTYNVVDKEMYPDQSAAESTFTDVDFLSNGFKLRASAADRNGSGATFIFAAWAESPFKYSLAR